MVARGEPALLGRRAGARHHHGRHRPRRRERGRGVRGRRPRLRADRRRRCRLDRLRPRSSGRSSARSRRCRPTTTGSTRPRRRSTTCASARRSRRRSTGDASRASPRTTRRPSRPRWSRRASPAGATATSCRCTTRTRPARCWPRPATRAAPGFPEVTLVTGGSPTTRRSSTELERELGIDDRCRDDGLRPYFDRLDTRSAGDVVPVVGRRLPRPQRLPRASCSAAGPSTTTAAGARPSSTRRSPTPCAATDEAAAERAYDRAEDVVQRDVPVIPMSYGTGWALSRTGSSAPGRTAWAPAHGGAGVGGDSDGAASRSWRAWRRWSLALALASWSGAAAAGPRGRVRVRDADASRVVRRGDRRDPAGDPRRARPIGSRCWSRSPTPGPAGHRGDRAGGRLDDAPAHARRTRRPHPAQHAGPRPLAHHDRRRRHGLGPEVRTVVRDDRFDWQTVQRRRRPGPLVRGRPGLRRTRPAHRRGGGRGDRARCSA